MLSGAREISALIEVLLDAAQRLEDLTSGEVDAVANSSGKTFLLRQAQERLRHNEAAIFDSLPAHVALLDGRGNIVSVNNAWRKFASENALLSPAFGVGVNYLDICDRHDDAGSAIAPDAAAGIRSVLSGARSGFSLEYLCPKPNELRWYLLTVNRVAGTGPRGAVVMHLDITERKHNEQALLRYGGAMDAIADAIYLTDRSTMRVIHVNDAACRAHGMTRKKILELDSWKLLGSSRQELENAFDKIIANTGEVEPIELLRAYPDGTPVWVELRRHAQRSEEGWTIVTLVRDVTERREALEKIKRLSRVYAMRSEINALIVRFGSRDELFDEACRVAVDTGGFRMAWVGTIDVATLQCDIVAWSGDEPGYADRMSVTASARFIRDAATQDCPLVFRQPEICNDVTKEPIFQPLLEELLRNQHRALAYFPLTLAGRTEAILALYSAEIDVFDAEETILLTQLSGDLSIALAHMQKTEKLEYLAYYDELTGLANLKLFVDRVARDVHGALRSDGTCVVVVIDIERFKNINDTFGRAVGDELLRQVADWLTEYVGDASLLARVGADRFAVLLTFVGPGSDVARSLEKMTNSFAAHSYQLDGGTFRIAAKFGVATFPGDGTEAADLFKNAESALKKAKASGDRLLFHNQRMTEAVGAALSLENQLRHALEKGQFVLHYQPKVSFRTERPTGVEALIRWNDPLTGLSYPGRFIKILEETGLILDVGRWALRQAMQDYHRWRQAGLEPLRVAVNVSPLQLRSPGFTEDVRAAILIADDGVGALELEITENLIMEDMGCTSETLRTLRALGVSVAIDDFGTGFSSLSYLSRLPVDTLKIDRTFIIDMTTGARGLALVSTIINLAHALELKVVAEGVETEEQSRLLRLLDCDEYQGYLISPALPVDLFLKQFLVPGS